MRSLLQALFLLGIALTLRGADSASLTPASATPMLRTNQVSILLTNGVVEVLRADRPGWDPASIVPPGNVLVPGNQLRTGDRSRAAVLLADRTVKQMGPNSLLTVLQPKSAASRVGLMQGVFHFFHRDDPGATEAETPTVSMVIRGTEFHVEVRPDGTTLVQLFDGKVDLQNAAGDLQLQGQEGAIIRPGQRPERAPALFARRVIQWALYYPAILSPEELDLAPDVRTLLGASISAYSEGDLIHALAEYPANRVPSTDPERLYLAALLLGVGEVDGATRQLDAVSAAAGQGSPIHGALKQLIMTVQGDGSGTAGTEASPAAPTTAVEWMAESYRLQSLASAQSTRRTNLLATALAAATHATEILPRFGFAWVRRAELEFSLGMRRDSLQSLERGLALAPRHAAGVVMRGFIAAAENRTRDALGDFQRAIELEPHLAPAWLGRGLIRIRRGDRLTGILDLEVAAALEPQRSVLRSYLGKGLADAGDLGRARHELELARALDPNDPTSWLYAALLEEKENRINESIRDLEHSIDLNRNRALYRSRLLLDQDRAVQGANLARIYSDAGMFEVGLAEASRASQVDYANPAARLFLAEAFDALRDPKQIQLRYETPWLNEYLMANLLAPVGSGSLSPYVTAQEFSKLFEQDRAGVVSQTEYLSRGDWHQIGVQHGTSGRGSYALEADGLWEQGQRVNGDREALTLRARVKQELSASDRVYLEVTRYDESSGDLSQHQDASQVNSGLRVKEFQSPNVLAGWTHEWDASSRTLILLTHLDDLYRVQNPQQYSAVTLHDPTTREILDAQPVLLNQLYRSELKVWSAEVQQIKQGPIVTFVAGARYQSGAFDSSGQQDYSPGPFPFAFSYTESSASSLERFTGYGWAYWDLLPSLTAVTGLSWDRVRFPLNHRYAPLSSAEESRARLSPKLGLLWTPSQGTSVRGAWWRTLGGVSLEQSYQLEPSQTVGFVHAYRSLMPESVAGSSAAPRQEGASLAWDQKHSSGTYYGLQADWLTSKVDRDRGLFEFDTGLFDIVPDSLRERLNYSERGLSAYLHQRIGEGWVVGAVYRISRAELEDTFLGVPVLTTGGFSAYDRSRATLQTARFMARYRHSSGFFTGLEAAWYHQAMAIGGTEDFWQGNLEAGWRFAKRSLELRVALLNLLDQDYRLHPINSLNELPRDRVLAAGLKWQF